MKKSSLFLLVGIFCILSSFVSAALTDDNQIYYSMDIDDGVDPTILDLSGNGNDGTLFNSYTNVSAKINEGAKLISASNQYITTGYDPGSSWSLSGWVNISSANEVIATTYTSGDTEGIILRFDASKFQVYSFLSPAGARMTSPSTYSLDTWHHVVITFSGTTWKMYVNNVNVQSTTTNSYSGDSLEFATFARSDGTGDYDGVLDEFAVWNKTLSVSEVDELYNSGNGYNPYPIISSNVTDSVESTAIVKQSGSITLLGPSFATIINSDFNITRNTSSLYGAYSFNVFSASSNTLFCELLINSVVVGNVTRTQTPNVLGSVFLQSPHFDLESGEHNQELRCRRSGGAGQITINNAIGIGHIMVNEDGDEVPHEYINISESTSSSSYTLLDELNFTISNRTVGGADNITHNLVIDWAANYENNAAGTELLSTYISVNGSNCSFYPRTVSSGGVGSVAGDCLFKNVIENATYNIKLYGNGTNAVFSGVLIAKEFALSPEEIDGGQGLLVGQTFNGSDDSLIVTVQGGNLNHGLTNIFQKQAYSILTNESTTVTMWIVLNNSVDFRTVNMTRDFVAGEVGVLIGHDIFEDVPQDDYNISVYANCGSPTAGCELVGGAGIGYITDVTTTLTNAFNVTVHDNYDGSVLSGFTVTDGATFNTTGNWLEYFSSNDLENLTIVKNDGDYFTTIIYNHNTSLDLNASMNQTLISWDCVETISGNDLNCSKKFPWYPVEGEIFNYNVDGNPHSENLAAQLTDNPREYFDKSVTFNVTALQNNSLNASFGYINLLFTASSPVGTVTTCDYDLSSLDYDWDYNETATPNSTGVNIINGDYSVFVDCAGFALTSVNLTFNHTLTSALSYTYNFTLFTERSINFTFFTDNNPLGLFTDQNVSFQIFTVDNATNYSTSDGYLYVDLLAPNSYEVRYFSSGYDERSYFFTVTDRSTEQLKLYLSDSNDTTNYIIRVADNADDDVVGAIVRLQRQYVEFDGQYVTIEECRTDSEGECDMFIQESSLISYRFIVLVNDEIVKVSEPRNIVNVGLDAIKRQTLRIPIGVSIYSSFDDIIGLFTALPYNNVTGLVNYSFIDSENQITGGCMKIIRRNIGRVGSQTVFNTCIIGSSGDILNINITPYILNDTVVSVLGLINYSSGMQIEREREDITTINKGLSSDDSDDILLTGMMFIMVGGAVVLIPNMFAQIGILGSVLYFLSFIGYNKFTTVGTIVLMIWMIIINWNRKNVSDGEPR